MGPSCTKGRNLQFFFLCTRPPNCAKQRKSELGMHSDEKDVPVVAVEHVRESLPEARRKRTV